MSISRFITTTETKPSGVSRFISTSSTKTSGVNRFITKKKAVDLENPDTLQALADKSGIGDQVKELLNPKPKLSTLQRIGAGLSSFETGNAVYTGLEKGAIEGIKEYGKGIIKGLRAAITGTDYGQTEKKTYKDIVEKMGIENAYAKFGIGFIGDVLLDPSTYFGGSVVKYGAKTVGKLGGKTLSTVGKISPKAEAGVRLIGEGLKDATGKAFKFGYGTTKGVTEKALETMGDISKAKEGIVLSNIKRLGTGTLSPDQQEELVSKLLTGKRAEVGVREAVEKNTALELGKMFPEIKLGKDFAKQNAKKILDDLENITTNKIEKIRSAVDDIVQPFFKERQDLIKAGKSVGTSGLIKTPAIKSFQKVDELNKVVDGLKKQLKEMRKLKGVTPSIGKKVLPDIGGEITKDEVVDVGNKLISYEEERLGEVIEQISKKLDDLKVKPAGIKNGLIDKGIETTPEETVVFAERLIMKMQNDLATKSQMLGKIIDSRKVANQLVKEAVETGNFSKLPKELAEKLMITSKDPIVANAIRELSVRSQKFSKQAGLEDSFVYYFPGIAKDKLKKFFDSARHLGVGSEGYKKQFKNLLKDEEMVRNPAEAFARVEFGIAKNNIVRKQLGSMIDTFGKQLKDFATEDEALKAGYKVVKEKGMLGKPMGYLKKVDKDFLDNLITPDLIGIDALAKATGFDYMTSLFKKSVTGLFPAFHVRNYVSGHIQNYEALGASALDPRNMIAGKKLAWAVNTGKKLGKETIDINGAKYSMNQLIKPFAKRFKTSSSYIADIGDATNDVLTKTDNIAFKTARKVGDFIETQQKATAYITALRKGNSVKQSLELATNAGFDYRALTGFESKIMRRIIPFYSFARKNFDLQIKTLANNPERINNIVKFIRNMGSSMSEEERRNLPDYVNEGFAIKMGTDKYGNPSFVTQIGTPLEAFAGLFGADQVMRSISMMNPMIKAPLELGFGKDTFRKRDLKDVYDAREYSAVPQVFKDILMIKEIEKPVYRNGAKTDETKTVYVADPERLLIARSLFTSRGFTFLDNVFDGDLQGLSLSLKLFTGLKAYSVDPETTQYFKKRDKTRAAEDVLQRYGEIKKLEKYYVPKK